MPAMKTWIFQAQKPASNVHRNETTNLAKKFEQNLL